MKIKLAFIFSFLFLFTFLFSQKMLTIYRIDGMKSQFSFLDNPEIILDNENLYIETSNIEVTYPFPKILKYTVNENPDTVSLRNIVIDDDNTISFDNRFPISNCNITYKRSFNDTEWQSLYVPFEINTSQLEEEFEFAVINNFHQYDDDNDGLFDRTELEIKKVSNKILYANYPYLIKAKEPGLHTISVNKTILFASESKTIDCSSVELKYTIWGNYKMNDDICNFETYRLSSGILNNSFGNISSFRWYLSITPREPQYKNSPIISNLQKINTRAIDDNEEFDSKIHDYNEVSTVAMYNISGFNVTKPTKTGTYIFLMSDGSSKKVMIK